MNAYINGIIVQADRLLEDHVLLADQKIISIIKEEDYQAAPDHKTIDLEGNYLIPGFIDVHIHGSNGYDTMDGTSKAFEEISRILPASGVTSYLAATMTMSKAAIHQSLACAQELIKSKHHGGAELLGIHAEGPFIAEKYKGAQNPEFIVQAAYDFYAPYYEIIRLITVAPETDLDNQFAKQIKIAHPDIILSIGHSSATYDQASKAYKDGYKHITHLFNAMTGLHHREPGIVGAALTDDFYTEIIADNVHIRPELYKLVLKAKGKDKIILITDAMCAACLQPGEYSLGGQDVFVDEDSARLASGALAGSILKMNKAVENFFTHTDLSLHEAINLASKNPAEELGLFHKIGSIDINKDADLAIMSKSFNILATYCKGRLTYTKEDIHAY